MSCLIGSLGVRLEMVLNEGISPMDLKEAFKQIKEEFDLMILSQGCIANLVRCFPSLRIKGSSGDKHGEFHETNSLFILV